MVLNVGEAWWAIFHLSQLWVATGGTLPLITWTLVLMLCCEGHHPLATDSRSSYPVSYCLARVVLAKEGLVLIRL